MSWRSGCAGRGCGTFQRCGAWSRNAEKTGQVVCSYPAKLEPRLLAGYARPRKVQHRD